MSISLGFYQDANLTNPITSPLTFEQAIDGSLGPQTRVVYLGSTVSNHKFESAINSGIDPIILNIYDSQPNAGQDLTSVKLALDPNDLDNVVAGQTLSLPATILSGSINSIPIYVQIEDQTGTVGTDLSLSLVTSSIIEMEHTL